MPIVLQLAAEPTVGEPWCDAEDLSNCAGCEEVDLGSVCAAASEIVHILSARRYGTRRVTIRPTRVLDRCACPDDIVRNYIINSGPLPFFGSGFVSCGCGNADGYTLNAPVREVHEVKVDGLSVHPSEYHLYGRNLVRGLFVDQLNAWTGFEVYFTGQRVSFENIGWIATQDGGGNTPADGSEFWTRIAHPGHWPCCQRLDLDPGQPGTWSIDYTWGKSVPYAGKLAVIALACVLAKLTAAGKCGIPDRATRVDRQGVSITLLDPKEFAKDGRTGVRVTDLWLSTINPSGARRRARFIGPDTPTGVRQ